MKKMDVGESKPRESVRLYAEVVNGYMLIGDGMGDNLPRPARDPNPNEGLMSGHRRIPLGHIALSAERIATYEDELAS